MYERILVTGSTGFLGHHLMPRLKSAFPKAEIIGVGRRDADLLEPGAPARLLRNTQPDCVVHMAAKSGGIITNIKRPAEFFYENVVMNTHMLHDAQQAGVKKFVTFMGGCSYPSDARSPIDESQMWAGYPQIESAGYSVAKKMLLTQSWAYRVQHGFNSIVLIPGNVYGEWDNFNLEEAHVIPALIRKYMEAQERQAPTITAFGTGKPTRDFVYAGDVMATIPWFIQNYNSSEPVNISAGRRISIRELAETVKKVTGFAGEIVWDATKPDGQMDKIFDVTRLHSLGLSCDTSLEDGLRRTTDWFRQARERGEVRL
ncbi:MAG TPA: NAD-dependent epimerase/dehydratase family protein [Kiritimatiellia bacterium]|jgi:GDP-L-fucose synthase|nr:NAD-dependent epimerase/dehydratase family protein [Lentisphaerota bacterium]HRV30602.1 NAD-dependent epimerase/dehydratase family protein [Kiritimatiellia bacterium]